MGAATASGFWSSTNVTGGRPGWTESPRCGRTPRQIENALRLPVVATLPWVPDVAEVYSHGARLPRRFVGSALVTGYRAAADAITGHVAARRDALTPTTAGRP